MDFSHCFMSIRFALPYFIIKFLTGVSSDMFALV